ncbi:MAG: AraC family transcriptional regulator [Stenotrophomonas sp.]|jgi:AraC-like DNA-binding protein|uniref:AraC family transcriptional regulator n=1 Tax=unclassified Stenotrophomonas TaxID=196198 RepID=UPI0028AAB84C|nr:AraC family transcriptional regulator [Stenotrophomonas sp.]
MHRRSGDRLAIADVPTNMLCGLLLMGRELGVNSESWLAGLRLSVTQLDDPRTRISYRQAIEVIRRALPTLPIDGVGLAMGSSQNGGNFGLLGLAMKTARTFGDAVRIGLDYQRNLGPLMTLSLHEHDAQTLALVATAPEESHDLLPFLCEELFSSVLMLGRELAGERFSPLWMELGYPAPGYAAQYATLFRCEVRFEQARHAVLLDRRWMDLPFASYNPVTSQQALALCHGQLASLSMRGETTAAVERLLRPQLRDNPQMSDVALALHLSERTLRRQLAEEETSFSEVHDRIRTERALELLQDPELGIAAIGNQLGFNDAREFRRAFKRWTGQTPSQTRRPLA